MNAITHNSSDFDIAIIGAGAAGLAAAIFAAETAQQSPARRSIVLIDGAKKPGAKILVSGGGRCNVTHAAVAPDDYCGGSSNIIRNVLRQFDEQATVRWMQSLGVELKQEPTGKLFPVTDSARTVLDALMNRVVALGIHTRFGCRIADVHPIESDPEITAADSNSDQLAATLWAIRASNGETITARRVIMATGGKALPKSGSDGAAYAWLARLGHTIVPPVPALAPLILNERGVPGSPLSRHFADLSGLTINARLSYAPDPAAPVPLASYDGSLLFTHFGLSGPAPMNLSRHIARHRYEVSDPGAGIATIGFELPGIGFAKSIDQADAWLKRAADDSPRMTVANLLNRTMPERLAQVLAGSVDECLDVLAQNQRRDASATMSRAASHQRRDASATLKRDAFVSMSGATGRLSDLTRQQRRHLAQMLHASPLAIKGDRGYTFAEATAGGIALGEINWRTMQSRKAPGLYLSGEILDVDGRIGGFNFQWAWSSGHIAGTAVGK